MTRLRRWPRVLLLRLRSLFRREAVDRELERELRFHLDAHVDELVAAGVSRAEARLQALREFGSPASISERCRDTRQVNVIEQVWHDLRYASRALVKERMLTVMAVTSISLGVGANLAIFALANSLLLSRPTTADPDRVVHIRSDRGSHVSYAMWRDLNDSGVIDGVAGYNLASDVNWRTASGSAAVMPLVVSANFFDVMRMPMAIGRGFTAVEAQAEREPRLAVVTHRFWISRLDADPNVIGSTLIINGAPFSVMGVLPQDLRSLPGYGISPDLWLPASLTLTPGLNNPRASQFQLIGRLRDGQTVEAAWAALNTVASRAVGNDAPAGAGVIRYVAPIGGMYQLNEFKEVALFFGGLIVVTWLVLAIACANVAGLLLARGVTRRKEIAMRLAIGASRRRLIQQLLTEGFVLSVLGTIAGLGITAIVARLLTRVRLPIPFPFAIDIAFDDRVVALGATLVVIATILSALAPALQATRPDVLPSLKQEVRGFTTRRLNLRASLVVAQVAVSVLLLVITVLFLRNLSLSHTATPGFDAAQILVAQITFVEGRQGTAARPAVSDLADALRALPVVRSVALADGVPLTVRNGGTTGTQVRIDGSQEPVRVDYDVNTVGPHYFDVMGIDLLRGRDFSTSDIRSRTGGPVIVNQEFVRRYLNGNEPIGTAFSERDHGQGQIREEIIGVVADSKYTSIGEDHDAAVYRPYLTGGSPARFVHVLVRTAGPPSGAAAVVRETINRFDPDAAITIEPMTSAIAFAFLPSRIGALLVGALGALGALLAMVGLYGVVSYAVQRRTSEIGIRLALGSSRQAIAAVVFKDGAVLVGMGLIIGVGLALVVTRLLSAVLVAGLSTTDTVSFVGTAILMALTSLLATWGPTRRAMRVEPAITLRSE
jgi:predicted permease